MAFELHPKLEADTVRVTDFGLCRVVLMNDASYPWLILVPKREGVTEVTDLLSEEQLQLMMEITFVAERLQDVTGCDKLNIAALGNQVPQLHIHVIARFTSDRAWPHPVWGRYPPVPYGKRELDEQVGRLAERFSRTEIAMPFTSHSDDTP